MAFNQKGNLGGQIYQPKDQIEYQKFITKASGQLVVVKNGTTWCPSCKTLGPILEDLAKKNTSVVFISVDVEVFCPF